MALLFLSSNGFASNPEPASSKTQPTSIDRPALILVQAPRVESDSAAERFPEGSRLVRLESRANTSAPVNLTADLFAAADPQISFNGERVIFSAQKLKTDKWQIWEMRTDGAEKRQVTNCPEDCVRADYLPDDEIVFTAVTGNGNHKTSYLVVAKSDGSKSHGITFGPGDWRVETVLRDGRILASASWPLRNSGLEAQDRLFYTIKPDGTALDSLRCIHKEVAYRSEASELEDGSIIFTKSAADGHYGGALAEIHQGELSESVLGAKDETFGSPRLLSAYRIMVARKLSSGSDSSGKFELYAFDLNKKVTTQKIYGDAVLNSIQPVPIVKHEVPKKYWSLVNPTTKSGYFIALDSYASGDEPDGRIVTPIRNVRVFTLQAGLQKEELLGEAPVEKDGSFYVEVPADQPVRFELLDATGRTVRAEHGWIWSRPGEQRGCAGCHGDKAVAPENRWPMTLKRFDTPTQFGEKQSLSAGSHAN